MLGVVDSIDVGMGSGVVDWFYFDLYVGCFIVGFWDIVVDDCVG